MIRDKDENMLLPYIRQIIKIYHQNYHCLRTQSDLIYIGFNGMSLLKVKYRWKEASDPENGLKRVILDKSGIF